MERKAYDQRRWYVSVSLEQSTHFGEEMKNGNVCIYDGTLDGENLKPWILLIYCRTIDG
jgi:hypothetical protein